MSIRRQSSWLLSAGALLLYLWAPMLAGHDLGDGRAVPPWVPSAAPLLFYSALLLAVPGVSAARRGLAVVLLAAAHAALGMATSSLYWLAGPAMPGPFDAVLWQAPAVPLVQVVAVPVMFLPLRGWLGRDARRAPRRGEAARASGGRIPAASGWDDVVHHTAGGERLREDGVNPEGRLGWPPPRWEPGPLVRPSARPTPEQASPLSAPPFPPPVVIAPVPGAPSPVAGSPPAPPEPAAPAGEAGAQPKTG